MSESLLPRKEVEKRCGLSRSSIYARMKVGTFPKPIHDPDSSIVWWRSSEIDAWIQSRIDAGAKRVA
jgi:prophage regulatory protein